MSDPTAVARALARGVGPGYWEIARLPSFAGDQVFLAACESVQVILKRAKPAGLAAEAAVCRLLRRNGIPAPEVLALELDDDNLGAYVIMRHVGGEPVRPADSLFREVGSHLRRVHEVELSGFGGLRADGGQLSGLSLGWADSVAEKVAGLDRVGAAGLLGGDLVDGFRAALERHGGLLTGVGRARLVHGDVHARHVYSQSGRLTGIIDWGDAMAGDPLFDLGRILQADERSLSLVLKGYGELPYQDEELALRLHVYAAVFIVSAMVSEYRAGAPWPAFFEQRSEDLRLHLRVLYDA